MDRSTRHFMRRPEPVELEAAFMIFLIVVPMAYWTLRIILAFVGL